MKSRGILPYILLLVLLISCAKQIPVEQEIKDAQLQLDELSKLPATDFCNFNDLGNSIELDCPRSGIEYSTAHGPQYPPEWHFSQMGVQVCTQLGCTDFYEYPKITSIKKSPRLELFRIDDSFDYSLTCGLIPAHMILNATYEEGKSSYRVGDKAYIAKYSELNEQNCMLLNDDIFNKPSCLYNLAACRVEDKYCDLIDESIDAGDKDGCYRVVGPKMRNSQVCEKIKDGQMRNYCYHDTACTSRNESLCDSFVPTWDEKDTSRWKNDCLAKVAVAKRDIKMCENIPSDYVKYKCYNDVAVASRNSVLCSKLPIAFCTMYSLPLVCDQEENFQEACLQQIAQGLTISECDSGFY